MGNSSSSTAKQTNKLTGLNQKITNSTTTNAELEQIRNKLYSQKSLLNKTQRQAANTLIDATMRAEKVNDLYKMTQTQLNRKKQQKQTKVNNIRKSTNST